jgi:Signal transduction histidine kinase
MFRILAKDKNLIFEIAISQAVPVMIYSDKNRLKQVLYTLINNSMKFTEQGCIKL